MSTHPLSRRLAAAQSPRPQQPSPALPPRAALPAQAAPVQAPQRRGLPVPTGRRPGLPRPAGLPAPRVATPLPMEMTPPAPTKRIARAPKDSHVSPTGRPRRSDFKAHRYNARTKEAVEFLALARYASIAHLAEHFGISMKQAHNIGYQLVRYKHAETRIVHNGMKAIWLTKSGMELMPHIDLLAPTRPTADKPWGHIFAIATLLSKLRRRAISTPFGDDPYFIVTEDQMLRAQLNLEKGDGVNPFAPENLPSLEALRTPGGATGMEHGYIMHNPRVSTVKHRPDLAIVRDGQKQEVIAFEVERQVKALKEYQRIMRLYFSSGVYDRVCYLYADSRPSIARRVMAAAEASGMNIRDDNGNFVQQRVECVAYSEIDFHAFTAGEVQTGTGLRKATRH